MTFSSEYGQRILQATHGRAAPQLTGASEAEEFENYGLSRDGKLTGAAYALGEVLRELEAARNDASRVRDDLGGAEKKAPAPGIDPVNKNTL